MEAARKVTQDIEILPSYFPNPGLGLVPVNAFVLKAPEPVLVDGGLPPRSGCISGCSPVSHRPNRFCAGSGSRTRMLTTPALKDPADHGAATQHSTTRHARASSTASRALCSVPTASAASLVVHLTWQMILGGRIFGSATLTSCKKMARRLSHVQKGGVD
jgi:hypothetical protein